MVGLIVDPIPQECHAILHKCHIVRNGEEFVDVDSMSSNACPSRILSEGEYRIHTSSEEPTEFLPFFARVFAMVGFNGISYATQLY